MTSVARNLSSNRGCFFSAHFPEVVSGSFAQLQFVNGPVFAMIEKKSHCTVTRQVETQMDSFQVTIVLNLFYLMLLGSFAKLVQGGCFFLMFYTGVYGL